MKPLKLNKKIKELTPKEKEKVNKILGDCQIIAFDIEEINEKIVLAYNLRQAAHETLLESDKLLDEVLKELRGIENNKTNSKTKNAKLKNRGVGKNPKDRKLGR
jgi:hypothetical protein